MLATGQTFVIMLGGIDLSIQAMASLASVIVALTIDQLGYGSMVLAVAVGALAGLAGGLAHVRLRIPSFIATLAIGGVLAGTALVISQARSITLDETQRGWLAWVSDTSFGIPHEIFIGAVVLLGAHLLQSRTRFGRYSAAIGAGEAAAYASGVKVGRQKVLALTLSGALRRPGRRRSWPAACRPARRRSPTSCCCRRSRPWWSAARRSPAASAASGAP